MFLIRSGLHKDYVYNIYLYVYNSETEGRGGRARLQPSDLGHLVAPQEQGLLAEGVDEDHPRVPVVAVGWGAGLRELVLGRQREEMA